MKTTAEHTKPFNREHAEAGAPYCCANRFEAKILEWVGTSAIGYFRNASGSVFPAMWDESGTEDMAVTHASIHNLVMTPLGFIDGKPVFVGDEYCMDGEQLFASPITRDWSGCSWPAAAPVIETKMTGEECYHLVKEAQPPGTMISVTGSTLHGVAVAFRSLANATIARAIADGQVVPSEQVQAEMRAIGEQMASKRAARDMAVAEAVKLAAIQCFISTSVPWHRLQELKLPFIVDKVK